MVRKRTQLLELFPDKSVTPSEASEALRKCHGDLDAARQFLLKMHTSSSKEKQPNQPPTKLLIKGKENDTNGDDDDDDDDAGENDSKISSPAGAAMETIGKAIMENPSNDDNGSSFNNTIAQQEMDSRRPPNHSVIINNLSDRQYCCVWWVEVMEDGYRPDIARSLLARVARHVNPILRDRGWRVKRLMESTSTQFLGCCYTNGRDDADAASANIQLNLRRQPNKHCNEFRSFTQILHVMLHEITHISIGLEDIHPPAFWDLLEEIKKEYKHNLEEGNVAKELETYGCDKTRITNTGEVSTVSESANLPNDFVDFSLDASDCGAGKRRNRGFRRRFGGSGGRSKKKRPVVQALGSRAAQQQQSEKRRPPLKKGAKMVDKRTKEGKGLVAAMNTSSTRGTGLG